MVEGKLIRKKILHGIIIRSFLSEKKIKKYMWRDSV